MCDYSVKISDYKLFTKPVDILLIKEKLQLIKNPQSIKWGAVLANGVLRISSADYRLIISLGFKE